MNSQRPARMDARRGALPRERRMRGFTLIEMLATLAIAAMLIAGVTSIINSTLADTRAQQAALYQSQLTAAATQLIRQNYTTLAAQATASNPVVVKLNGTPFQLSTYLSSATSAVNAYGQTPCLLIYGTATPGALQGLLVTEGGTAIPDTELGYAAANAGAGGGSIQATNNPGGAAVGAFGGWSVASPNPANAACSGTKTGVGHLASLVFFNGAQSQNADFLYRVGVPGDPAANTMQVPIVLAQQPDFAACTQSGSIAADAAGNVLNCGGGIWTPQASFHWREPVADFAALGSVTAMQGDVRMTLATNRAYTFNGTSWQALAVDQAGNLALGNAQTVGADCASAASGTTAASDTTLVSTDSTGRVLSCRGGKWQTQSEIEPVFQLTGCQIIMADAGAGDFPTCAPQPATNFATQPYSFNTTNGTFSYVFKQQVSLSKPGIIVVQSFAHMNDGLCGPRQGHEAQISQDVDIFDSNGNNIGHQESQSATLTDDSGGINNSLTEASTPDTYTVQVTTNWATFAVITTPWTSSFCGEQGQTITNTPVAAGWTINAYD